MTTQPIIKLTGCILSVSALVAGIVFALVRVMHGDTTGAIRSIFAGVVVAALLRPA